MEGPKHALEHLDRTLQTRIVRIANFEVVHADAPVICGEVHVIGVVVKSLPPSKTKNDGKTMIPSLGI